MQKLRLGISTCPNDTFIYEALVQGLIHSEFAWEVTFADVQTLNEMVLAGNLDVAKVSCGVLPQIQSNYRLLSCGGAMGYGCGPLLLSSRQPLYFSFGSRRRKVADGLLFLMLFLMKYIKSFFLANVFKGWLFTKNDSLGNRMV